MLPGNQILSLQKKFDIDWLLNKLCIFRELLRKKCIAKIFSFRFFPHWNKNLKIQAYQCLDISVLYLSAKYHRKISFQFCSLNSRLFIFPNGLEKSVMYITSYLLRGRFDNPGTLPPPCPGPTLSAKILAPNLFPEGSMCP